MLPGDRLKAARKKLGLSLAAIGEKTGYSHGHLSMVEGNKKGLSPRLLNLLQLSLGINPAYITDGKEPMFLIEKSSGESGSWHPPEIDKLDEKGRAALKLWLAGYLAGRED